MESGFLLQTRTSRYPAPSTPITPRTARTAAGAPVVWVAQVHPDHRSDHPDVECSDPMQRQLLADVVGRQPPDHERGSSSRNSSWSIWPPAFAARPRPPVQGKGAADQFACFGAGLHRERACCGWCPAAGAARGPIPESCRAVSIVKFIVRLGTPILRRYPYAANTGRTREEWDFLYAAGCVR